MSGDRYAELKAFIAEWFRPLEPGDGYTETDIAAAEARLGFRLPAALREWYLLGGRRVELCGDKFGLVTPGNLTLNKGLLRFWEDRPTWDDEGIADFYAIRGDDSAEDDPYLCCCHLNTETDVSAEMTEIPVSAGFRYLVMETGVFALPFMTYIEHSYNEKALPNFEAMATPFEDRLMRYTEGSIYRVEGALALLNLEVIALAGNDRAEVERVTRMVGAGGEYQMFVNGELEP